MVIDSGPVLLSMLLVGSILISSLLHLFIKNHFMAALTTALITVAVIITTASISIGFFEKELLLGVVPGLVISFFISYLVWGALQITRKSRVE